MKKRLILASASPRRSEILRGAGVRFTVMPANADESVPDGLTASGTAELLARRKCLAASEMLRANGAAGDGEDIFLLAADTLVECCGVTLGKPRDRDDARRMLSILSGGGSAVHTGYAIMRLSDGAERGGFETTYVAFDDISAGEIEAYISTDEPYDKAGAYGIQGRAALYIPGITGDYFNVMGLPLHAVYAAMRDEFGVLLTEFE